VLAVKDNQKTLHQKVAAILGEAALDAFKGLRHGFVQTVDGDHGRIETRRVWVTDEVQWLKFDEPWPRLGSLILVESVREVDGKTSVERRHFVSSPQGTDAARVAGLVRGHWSVENNLHWQLDVGFGEGRHDVGYVIGLARNKVLEKVAEPFM